MNYKNVHGSYILLESNIWFLKSNTDLTEFGISKLILRLVAIFTLTVLIIGVIVITDSSSHSVISELIASMSSLSS